MRRSRVHVLGASGSGTTTLGRALADRWSVPHADADDYFWVPTIPPFAEKRSAGERVALMREVFVPREAWVLSGSVVGWGESVIARCDAVVFLTLDPDERMRRLEAREVHRRAGEGFDELAWSEFKDWARGYDDPAFEGRSLVAHEAWLSQLDLPVLRPDSTKSVAELLDAVLGWPPESCPST
ncbi:P-loop NTPase family protein [Humibacter soli]